MPRTKARPRAFSLVELLVVLGIIAILIALLLPVLSRARHAGRNTQCLATLHTWGHAFRMYADANRGRAPALGNIPARMDLGTPPFWWELLQPYHGGDIAQALLCPEATEPANITPRNSFQAWGPEYLWDAPDKPRGPFVGSYTFNGWFLQPGFDENPTGRDPTAVPILSDGASIFVNPRDTDKPASYEAAADSPLSMRGVALKRHNNTGVNIVFLDGHTAHVELPALWRQLWSRTFTPRDVKIDR